MCQDDPGSKMFFNVRMPDSYDGGDIVVQVSSVNTDVAEGDTLVLSPSCGCASDSDAFGDDLLVPCDDNMVTTYETSGDIEHSSAPPCDIDGTCEPGDELLCSFVVNDTGTGVTNMETDLHILGARIEYGVSSATD
jgi:hypothetical protein